MSAAPNYTAMSTTALTSWYGSNRILAEHVGAEMRGCSWVLIPFAGGMSEVPHIQARSLLVGDLHEHLINLARTAAHPTFGPALYRRVKRLPFHPDILRAAQARCLLREQAAGDPDTLFGSGFPDPRFERGPDLDWAADYFVCSWMGRGGRSGTKGEFGGGLSLRWDAGGGDSAKRYASAVASLVAWRRALRRCNFVCGDGFELLARATDAAGNGVYCDPPFPVGGEHYKHGFDPVAHRSLAESLNRFAAARVVLRYYDHPLVRELYPAPRWTWVCRTGRKTTNDEAPEVLIINGPSCAEGGSHVVLP